MEISGGIKKIYKELDCGESGTTLRFLMPLAAVLSDEITFYGRGRLMSRPLEDYINLFSKHSVSCNLENGILRLKGTLTPGRYQIRGDVSSQYVSGLLLALPLLESDSVIELTTELESSGYVDLTLDMMQKFGVIVERETDRFIVRGKSRYTSANIEIEGDYSQAAFFMVAGALGCDCGITGLKIDSLQGDRMILDILKKCGAKVSLKDGEVKVVGQKLTGQNIDVSNIPDLVPPLAAFFSFCEGKSILYNASRLRYKESDRLMSISKAMNSLGADVRVDGDSLVIIGTKSIHGGTMDSFGDHRIAMMGAVAAVRCENTVSILRSESVNKSYPNFWSDFGKEVK